MRFSILKWSAWAPGLEASDDWSEWAHGRRAMEGATTPVVDFVPPLLRRRLSGLSRAALWVAFQCAPAGSTLRTVFASPHGEIHRTKALLDDLARTEPLSPNAFSLSVHNTASGLYAIASGNRAPSTAIAAGCDTLELAVVEAMAAARAAPAQPVLVVFADEPLPEFYRGADAPQALPFALALLLGEAGADPVLTLTRCVDGASKPQPLPRAHGLDVLRLLTGAVPALTLAGMGCHWQWGRG